jgi:hypothetical protein
LLKDHVIVEVSKDLPGRFPGAAVAATEKAWHVVVKIAPLMPRVLRTDFTACVCGPVPRTIVDYYDFHRISRDDYGGNRPQRIGEGRVPI